MRVRSRTAFVAVLAALAMPTDALAGGGGGNEPKLVASETSQSKIADKGAIPVKAKNLEKKITVVAQSKTFDSRRFQKLSDSIVLGPNDKSGKLPLNARARRAIESCQPRTIKLKADGAKNDKFKLKRDLSKCRPPELDFSRAAECNTITLDEGAEPGEPACMLPFPDDFHTTEDYTSATGRRVSFQEPAMPQNSTGTPVDPEPYNLNDGFSPGQTTVVRVPGLDNPEAFAETDPITLDNLSRNDKQRKNEPVVVIDTETGERWPIWVELDSNATTPQETALLIHPATNYASGHRYIVAMRKLKGDQYSEGKLKAPDGFRAYRDRLAPDYPGSNAQRKRFERVFRELRDAGIKRSNLYLAWDFTVATDENIAERLLHMRNDAFSQLGDESMDDEAIQGDSPEFEITSVQNLVGDPELARIVEGTFEVPCYLQPNCEPRGRFELGANGLPSQNGTYTAPFRCGIPHAAVDDAGAEPARPQVYGHGLLGSRSQATSGDQQILAQTHNFVICSVDTIGFSSGDVPNIATRVLRDLGNFPEVTDRTQQGQLNTLFLGRLMWHEDGLVSDPAFHVDGTTTSAPVIDTSRLYYNGNSQGGILGGAATAVAPDWTRASLGVPAMNYSVLLNRSVDFDTYSLILNPAYPSKLDQQLILSMIQMLWDRSEPNGYAHRMTDNPLPETPPHEVLMNVAFGDHQVTTWQADVEARTIGAKIHTPVVYDGRWPGVDVAWGIEPIPSYPYTGSAIVYWDSGPTRPDPGNPTETIGTDPPPITNTPNRSGEDPHSDPRVDPQEMEMVSDFLMPDAQSHITDTCLGLPCFAGAFDGP
ncbi:MAG: hypothetical protein M3Y34_07270 [Actinomycetota bacterium]|nr:hypothetical protein [Actinomycetota bacterium]